MCNEARVLVVGDDDTADAFGTGICVEGVGLFFYILPLARSGPLDSSVSGMVWQRERDHCTSATVFANNVMNSPTVFLVNIPKVLKSFSAANSMAGFSSSVRNKSAPTGRVGRCMSRSTSENSHIVELHSGVVCPYKYTHKEVLRKKRWA